VDLRTFSLGRGTGVGRSSILGDGRFVRGHGKGGPLGNASTATGADSSALRPGRAPQLSERTNAGFTQRAGWGGFAPVDDAETELLAHNNALYREKFGFPFVLCVRLNNAEAILGYFSERLKNTRAEEIGVALAEISKIARVRLADFVL
jgi:OHCU decarboxylase